MGEFITTPEFVKRSGNTALSAGLLGVMQEAAAASPYNVVAFSGIQGRAAGTANHPSGHGIDIYLQDPRTGKYLANYTHPVGGVSPSQVTGTWQSNFPAYEQFAQTARVIQQQRYPELNDTFRWGGYFNPGRGNSVPDLMHFDDTPKMHGAMGAGSWEGGASSAAVKRYGISTDGGLSANPKLSANALASLAGHPVPPLTVAGPPPIPMARPAGRDILPPLPRARPADLPPPSLTSNAQPPMPLPRPVTDVPVPMPNAPYTVNRTGPHQMQSTVLNGAVARGLDSIPDGAYQPIANGLSGLMGVVAPQQMPPLPRERPTLPDLPPPSLATSNFAARPDVLAPNTFNSPFVNPGVQGLSPDARNPLPSIPGAIKTTGGIAGTVQMPRNVRPNIGPLPSSTLPLANEALVAGAPIDSPMPLPPPSLTGGLNPQGTIVGQEVTPVVPLPRLERQPAPVVPLSPPPEELAALREKAQNPLQRLFGMTPLGHITSFVQNLGQAPHYGAPATGGLLAMLTGHGGVGGAQPGGLLGLLGGLGHSNVTPQQVTGQFTGLTPAQMANQNPLALAAGLAGQTAYSAPTGLLMPTIAVNGNRRNSLTDYGNGGSPYASNGSLSSLV